MQPLMKNLGQTPKPLPSPPFLHTLCPCGVARKCVGKYVLLSKALIHQTHGAFGSTLGVC